MYFILILFNVMIKMIVVILSVKKSLAMVYALSVDQLQVPPAGSPGVAKSFEAFSQFPDLSQQNQRAFTWADLGQCDGTNGGPLCIVVDDSVYNVTNFVDSHAGGPSNLMKCGGRDAGDAMRATAMPAYAFEVMKRFRVGYIVPSDRESGSKC